MAYRLEPPKSHPVLRDPTIPYKATKRPRKFVSSSAAALTTVARPAKLHIRSGEGSENNVRKCLVGSKDRYDKKGRLRMVKFSKSTLAMHDSFDAKEIAQQQQKKQEHQRKEDRKTKKRVVSSSKQDEVEREDEIFTEQSEDEEDESILKQNHDSDIEHDLVAHEEYHSNSASPEPHSRPSSPILKKQTKTKVVVTTDETSSNTNMTTTKSFDNMYEDATFITGARDLPLWVRSERKSGLQQILHEYFGNRYAISRWKRKKQVPEYDPRHFVDLF